MGYNLGIYEHREPGYERFLESPSAWSGRLAKAAVTRLILDSLVRVTDAHRKVVGGWVSIYSPIK